MFDEIISNYEKLHLIQFDLEGAGFGAMLLQTLNQLRYCDKNNFYPIVAYTENNRSAFFDRSKGVTLWEQYFEPVRPFSYTDLTRLRKKVNIESCIHTLSTAEALRISEEHTNSVYTYPFGKWRIQGVGDLDRWYNSQRKKGRETVAKYIRPKLSIQRKVDTFFEINLADSFVLGVHIRGTDLHYAPAVSPAEYFPYVDEYIKKESSLKLIIATDQSQYLSVFEERYGNRVVSSNAFRSDNEIAPFQRKEISPYQKGEDVLVDILLLSKSNFLLKGCSNVGEMALYFNPKLECLDIGYKKDKAYGQDYGKGWDNMTNPPAWKLISQRGLQEIAGDVSSQNKRQLALYNFRKWTKRLRVYMGKMKRVFEWTKHH